MNWPEMLRAIWACEPGNWARAEAAATSAATTRSGIPAPVRWAKPRAIGQSDFLEATGFAGLASGLEAAGLLSPPLALLVSPAEDAAGAASFLAASLYFSLR